MSDPSPEPSAESLAEARAQRLEMIDRGELRCEQCGAFTPRGNPWPRSWFETGRSEKYASMTNVRDPSKRRPAERFAAWCSEQCYATHRSLKTFRRPE